MKVDLRVGTDKKEFVYPDDVIFVGISFVNIDLKISITEYLQYFGNISVTEEKLIFPCGEDATLFIYKSDDETLRQIIKKYKGLTVLEFCSDEVEIIATL